MDRDGWEHATAYQWLVDQGTDYRATVWLTNRPGPIQGVSLQLTPELAEAWLSLSGMVRLIGATGFAVAAQRMIPAGTRDR